MKKRTATLITIGLFIVLFMAAPSAAEEAPFCGDLTGDGITSAADAAAMLRGLAFGRLSADDRPDLDFTYNGEIDGMDARAALLYACGGIESLVDFGERVASGLCDESLFDHFSYTGIRDDGEGNYKSDTVSVTISSGRVETSNYHLADIYVQDIACMQTAFSGGVYRGGTATVRKMFDATSGAVIAMNGDYYTQHYYGPIIRNGITYSDRINRSWDIAVLLTNGELLTYNYRELTTEILEGLEVYQSWVFGPALLDAEGHAKTKFRSAVTTANPRSVIGYYEPGHYAFLAVDGRSSKSKGLTMSQLSQLCEDLGFAAAYNLDGGQSSVLLSQDGPINVPYRDGRPISDVLVVCDLQEE